jgi:uncharacterized coiled-coil protein SlyX
MSAADERLVDLEVRVAYQDKIIATLDEVLRDFTARVERLEQYVKERGGQPPPIGPQDDRPPHY